LNCRDARSFLSPYLDSSLDATTTYAISRHLDACEACRRYFSEEQTLDEAIFDRLRAPRGDEEDVFDRALARAVPRAPRFRRLALPLAVAALLVVSVLVALLTLERAGLPGLLRMTAEDHAKFVRGELVSELAVAEPEAAAAFLEERLGRIGDLPSGGGWRVEGVRICRFRGQQVGYVMLRYGTTPVSLVTAPERARATFEDAGSAARGGRSFALERARGLVRRTDHGFRAVVGDLPVERLSEALEPGR